MKKYIVTLSKEERQQLQALVKKGRAAARTRLHAQILLHADTEGGGWTDEDTSLVLDGHPTTVANVRRRCVEEGLGRGAPPASDAECTLEVGRKTRSPSDCAGL